MAGYCFVDQREFSANGHTGKREDREISTEKIHCLIFYLVPQLLR